MNNQDKVQEIDSVRDLLLALEVGTKKEDKKLIEGILSRHNICRPRSIFARQLIDNLSHIIVAGPGFETFFLDVVRCVRPFALMVQEVFGFLATHAATTKRRSSSVRVSLQGATQAFDFDLSGFPREKLEMIMRTRGRSEILRLTHLAKEDALRDTSKCWVKLAPIWDGDFYDDGFYRALSYANTILSRGEGERKTIADVIGPVIDRLAALAQILKWPEVFPDHYDDSRENTSYMDNASKILRWSLPMPLGSILEREDTSLALLAKNPPGVSRNLKHILEGIALAISLWDQEDFRRLDHRDWLSQRLGMPFEVIMLRHFIPLIEMETVKIAAALDEIVEVVRVENFEAEVRATLDFLRLPFWRDRWFLYELWTVVYVLNIGSATWQLRLLGLVSRDDEGIEWVLPGGVAREPIAIIEGETGSVECWSQRKTYHPTTGKGLEPDLRLTRASDRHEDLIVIENKDRIKPGKREMKEIIERYVTGTLAQTIWLVNYEQFTDQTHAVSGEWTEGLVFIESHFRPGEVSPHFPVILQQILNKELGPIDKMRPSVPATLMPNVEATVTLIWEKPPNDLDIHAWVREGRTLSHICFNNRGQLGEPPYIRLDTDCQNYPGREEILIERILGEAVDIAIHQYSDDGQIKASQARVEIRRSGQCVATLLVPSTGVGRWWWIGTFGNDGNLVIRNIVTTEFPCE